ncbi:MAG: YkvA family protein [Actinomycetota bacterium]|nr:YkvA family protein [Actinomycetota bacterium]
MISSWRKRAKELKTETHALYLAYKDPRVAWYAKAFAALVVAYAFSPIDLIPDPIPILGYLDDLILVPLGIALAIKMIPPGVMAECREKARLQTAEKRPKNWTAALIIVIIWFVLAYLVVRFIYRVARVSLGG